MFFVTDRFDKFLLYFRKKVKLILEEKMRLDKYLKVTRLVKRRTIANEACDAGKVLVNDKVVKASYNVKVDDIITINLGQKPLKVKVLSISEHTTKENAADNYIVVD